MFMTIRAILQLRDTAVQTIGSANSVGEAVRQLSEQRIGAMPVLDDGKVQGVISERDIIYGLAREGDAVLERKVADLMISPCITVEPDAPALHALSLMTRRRVRHLPVIEAGTLIGFVSIGDIVKYRIDRIEAEANAMRDYIQMA
jgi:CBS domain-containing protein